MGGSQSRLQEELNTHYDAIGELDHPVFGQVLHLKDKNNNQQCFLKEYIAQDKEQHDQILHDLHQQERSQNLVNTIDIRPEEQKEFCSNIYKIYHIFDFSQDLLSAINEKSHQHEEPHVKMFNEHDLVDNYIQPTAAALLEVEQQGAPCTNLRPQSVLLNGDTNRATLANQRNLKIDEDNLQDYKNEPHIYLAPELLHSEGVQDRRSNVYSLGMTMLHASTLNSQDDLYHTDRINVEEKEKRLNELRNHYSDNYVNLLESMLNENPNQRIPLEELARVSSQTHCQQFEQPAQQVIHQAPQQVVTTVPAQQVIHQQPVTYEHRVESPKIIKQTAAYNPEYRVISKEQYMAQIHQPNVVTHQDVHYSQHPVEPVVHQSTTNYVQQHVPVTTNYTQPIIHSQVTKPVEVVHSHPTTEVIHHEHIHHQPTIETSQKRVLTSNVKTISKEEYERLKAENNARSQKIDDTVKYGSNVQREVVHSTNIAQSSQPIRTISKEEYERIKAERQQPV